MSDRIKALKTMRSNVSRRVTYWKNSKTEDPHDISQAVYVALQEILSALDDTILELDK